MTVLRRGVVAMALAFGLASGAGAALIDKGNETVLDTSTNLLWLKDPTFAGYSDWRLPKVTDTGAPGCDFSYNNTDCGFNVDPATGEMARLWDVSLGNTPAAVAGEGRALSKNLTPGARQAARDAHLDERDTACVYPGSSVNSSCGRATPFIA
jgi:hypothetical protein